METKEARPLVSICCTTFNQVQYIDQAIESFLRQKTDYPIEIIIHDDASTDGTAEKVKAYANRYPDLIFPILQKENQWSQGAKPSATYVWPRARGKYIALCEGDDYWTDELKLQKQVDFLEANSTYTLTHHQVNLLREGTLEPDPLNNSTPETTTILDLAKYNYIRTLSVVFRNPHLQEYPDLFQKSPVGDYVLYLFLLNKFPGKIRYFDDLMGVYRIHGKGMWENTNYDSRIKKMLSVLEILIGEFNSEVDHILKDQYVERCWQLYQQYKALQPDLGYHYLTKAATIDPGVFRKFEQHLQGLELEKQAILESRAYRIGNVQMNYLGKIRKLVKRIRK